MAEAVGQNREVIEDGRSGRLVPPGDAAVFAAAVSGLPADPDRRRAMGSAARERVSAAFARLLLAEVLEAVYGIARHTAGWPGR